MVPKRCPSRKCRSIAWNAGAVEESAIASVKVESAMVKSAMVVRLPERKSAIAKPQSVQASPFDSKTLFRGTGKCPHGWCNWQTCKDNKGGCE